MVSAKTFVASRMRLDGVKIKTFVASLRRRLARPTSIDLPARASSSSRVARDDEATTTTTEDGGRNHNLGIIF